MVMLTALAIMGAVSVGTSLYSAISTSQANKKNLSIQKRALAQEQAEIDRQKRREIEQKKRENEQLMNSISKLTGTSYSGVSAPSIDYDKYGDMG